MVYFSTHTTPHAASRIDTEEASPRPGEPLGRQMPTVLLAAGVLAVSDVTFVLVGSGALWLRGQPIHVRDVDAVIEPTEPNLLRLRAALAALALSPRMVPSATVLGGLHLVSVTTSYGRIDALLERGRLDWNRLRASASVLPVADAEVVVADLTDAWALRNRYKE